MAVGLHLLAYADRAHAGPWLLAGVALWGFMVLLGNITQAVVSAARWVDAGRDDVDIRSVAEFYRELLGLHYRMGGELADGREPDSADWLVLLDDDGRRILTFQRTEELKPSTWPSPEVPMQLHLDFIVPDRDSLDAAHDHALRSRVLFKGPRCCGS